jgi:hypothetical protein
MWRTQNAVTQRALSVLKQKKMYESQLAQLTQQTYNMEQAAMTTENLKNTVGFRLRVTRFRVLCSDKPAFGPLVRRVDGYGGRDEDGKQGNEKAIWQDRYQQDRGESGFAVPRPVQPA